MTHNSCNFGPYIDFVSGDGIGLIKPNGILNSIAYDAVRYENYVTNYVPFCRFVEFYLDDLVNNLRDCLLLASALATISKLKQGYGNSLLAKISDRFDILLSDSEAGLDNDELNALLGATRLAMELRCPIGNKVAALIRLLEQIGDRKNSDEVRDATSVLHNNRDVFEHLYDGRLDESSESRLDDAIQKLEGAK